MSFKGNVRMAASWIAGIDKQERKDRGPLCGDSSCQPGLSGDVNVITIVLPGWVRP